MDTGEREGCARLFTALSQLDDAQKGYDEVLSAICQIAGTTNGGLWGVPQNFLAAPRLADVSYIKARRWLPRDPCVPASSTPPSNTWFRTGRTSTFSKPIDVIGWNAL